MSTVSVTVTVGNQAPVFGERAYSYTLASGSGDGSTVVVGHPRRLRTPRVMPLLIVCAHRIPLSVCICSETARMLCIGSTVTPVLLNLSARPRDSGWGDITPVWVGLA